MAGPTLVLVLDRFHRTHPKTDRRALLKGNLGYYKRKHPWRVARWCASFLAIVGGIAGIILFQKRGNEEFFSSGKISSSHAAFAQDCAKCHDKGAALGDHESRWQSLRASCRTGSIAESISRRSIANANNAISSTRCTNRTWSKIVRAQSAIRNTSDRDG